VTQSSTLTFSPLVQGLSADHQAAVTRMVQQIQSKQGRNRLRRSFYDYKQTLARIGFSIPPSMRDMHSVLGWPAKAVDSMVRRTVLDSWTVPDGLTTEDIGIAQVYADNRLDSELPAALTSTLMHAVSFVFSTAGDVASGEPESMVTVRSAEWATGTWDARRRCLSEALSITAVDTLGAPTDMALYLPGLVVLMRRTGSSWDLRQVRHDLGVPVEPVPYRPLLDRPFGSSRISRPVMDLTNAAMRTFARTEVGAEFFNAPQRYALGADEAAFKDESGATLPGWSVVLGRMLTLTRDEDGNLPTVGQFPQQSMVPNIDHFRMISQAFAAETSLPLRALGVMGDNPESAESQQMAERELELEIRNWQKSALTPALHRAMTNSLRILDDSPAARGVYRQMRPHWKRPDTIALGAAVDAVQKIDAVSPGFGASAVGLEMAGLEPEQIERWRTEQVRLRSSQNIAALTGSTGTPPRIGGGE